MERWRVGSSGLRCDPVCPSFPRALSSLVVPFPALRGKWAMRLPEPSDYEALPRVAGQVSELVSEPGVSPRCGAKVAISGAAHVEHSRR